MRDNELWVSARYRIWVFGLRDANVFCNVLQEWRQEPDVVEGAVVWKESGLRGGVQMALS